MKMVLIPGHWYRYRKKVYQFPKILKEQQVEQKAFLFYFIHKENFNNVIMETDKVFYLTPEEFPEYYV